MKKYLFLIGLWVIFGNTQAQTNQVPIIDNIRVQVDTLNQKVSLLYNVQDVENDPLTVILRASTDGGFSYNLPLNNLTGDVGSGINIGTNKKIVWNYDKSLLAPGTNVKFKLIAHDNQPIDIQAIVDRVSETRLKNDVYAFSKSPRHRTANPQHLSNTKDTIQARFEYYGLPADRFPFTSNNKPGENIFARKGGAVNDSTTVLITGHFDTVANSPGADDNASAVAGVLEAQRVLSGYEFQNAIKFVAFDLEEEGLLGSIDYVANQIPPYEKIDGVLNFEMLGYYSEEPNSQKFPTGFDLLFPTAHQQVQADQSRGNFITNVGNTRSKNLMNAYAAAAQKYVPDFKVISLEVTPARQGLATDLMRSDHAPFWLGGYSALMLTDGANFRNLSYHTPNDTAGSLNYTFMAQVVKAAIGTAAEMAVPLHGTSRTTDSFALLDSLNSTNRSVLRLQDLAFNAMPNPFDDKIFLNFTLKQAAPVKLTILNAEGRTVAHLVEDLLPPCEHSIAFDTQQTYQNLPEGLYFAVLNVNGNAFTKRILLIRTPIGCRH